MKKLLALVCGLLLSATALAQNRQSVSRLEVSQELTPPKQTNCSRLTGQRAGNLCFDTTVDIDGDGTAEGQLMVYTSDGAWVPVATALYGTSVPGSCDNGTFFIDTATSTLYGCISGTFTAVGGGGGSSDFDSLTDTNLTSVAQGDILYWDGTDWVNLAPGVSGQYLKTQGAAANPTWDNPAGSGDVTGGATSVDNEIVKFNSTTGKVIQASTSNQPTISDAGVMAIPGGVSGDLDVADDIFAPKINTIFYAKEYATGGDGTSGTPWTGWESIACGGTAQARRVVFQGRAGGTTGYYELSSTCILGTGTVWEGISPLATRVQMNTGFSTATPLIQVGTTAAIFNSKITNMTLDCQDVVDSIGVYSEHTNENTTLDRVTVTGCYTGIEYNGTGVQNYVLSNLYILSSDVPSDPIGIYLHDTTSSGTLSDISIDKQGTGSAASGVALWIENPTGLNVEGIRLEGHDIGIQVGVDGSAVGSPITLTGVRCGGEGGGQGGTTCIDIDNVSGLNKEVIITGAFRSGDWTNLVVDGLNSITITDNRLGFYSNSSISTPAIDRDLDGNDEIAIDGSTIDLDADDDGTAEIVLDNDILILEESASTAAITIGGNDSDTNIEVLRLDQLTDDEAITYDNGNDEFDFSTGLNADGQISSAGDIVTTQGNQLRIGAVANTSISRDSGADRLFHDTNSDGVKDAGEDYIDFQPDADIDTDYAGPQTVDGAWTFTSAITGDLTGTADTAKEIDQDDDATPEITSSPGVNVIFDLDESGAMSVGDFKFGTVTGGGTAHIQWGADAPGNTCLWNNAGVLYEDQNCDGIADAADYTISHIDGTLALGSATCIENDASNDRYFNDADCDTVKDSGEKYLDDDFGYVNILDYGCVADGLSTQTNNDTCLAAAHTAAGDDKCIFIPAGAFAFDTMNWNEGLSAWTNMPCMVGVGASIKHRSSMGSANWSSTSLNEGSILVFTNDTGTHPSGGTNPVAAFEMGNGTNAYGSVWSGFALIGPGDSSADGTLDDVSAIRLGTILHPRFIDLYIGNFPGAAFDFWSTVTTGMGTQDGVWVANNLIGNGYGIRAVNWDDDCTTTDTPYDCCTGTSTGCVSTWTQSTFSGTQFHNNKAHIVAESGGQIEFYGGLFQNMQGGPGLRIEADDVQTQIAGWQLDGFYFEEYGQYTDTETTGDATGQTFTWATTGWCQDCLVGLWMVNVTDESQCQITSNTSLSATCSAGLLAIDGTCDTEDCEFQNVVPDKVVIGFEPEVDLNDGDGTSVGRIALTNIFTSGGSADGGPDNWIVQSNVTTLRVHGFANVDMTGATHADVEDLQPNLQAGSGTHTGATNNAVYMLDEDAKFKTDALIGYTITNTTKGESGTITDNGTCWVDVTLSGSEDWDTGDAYTITALPTSGWVNESTGQIAQYGSTARLTLDGADTAIVFANSDASGDTAEDGALEYDSDGHLTLYTGAANENIIPIESTPTDGGICNYASSTVDFQCDYTISGNTTTLGTTSGALGSGNCAEFDGNGNIIDSGAGCGGGSGDNITINTGDPGDTATDADFDDTVPSAPANGVNVKWQSSGDSPTSISAYLPLDGGIAGVGLTYAGQTLATLSNESGFLEDGSFACGAGTQGRIGTNGGSEPLQYCDGNVTIPVLKYAAYAESDGDATSLADNALNNLTDIADLCAANEGVRRNGGDTAWECFTPSAGGGAFDDSTDPVDLNTTTKDVVIGTGAVNTSKLTIDGDDDQVQLTIDANGTQTDSVMIVEDGATNEVVNIEADGEILVAAGQGLGSISAGALNIGATNTTSITLGGTAVTGITVTADAGSGTTTFEVPDNAIDTSEITNGSLSFADFNFVSAADPAMALHTAFFTSRDNGGIIFEGDTADAQELVLTAATEGADVTVVIPWADTTLVGTDVTQTLTNKTFGDTTTFDDNDALDYDVGVVIGSVDDAGFLNLHTGAAAPSAPGSADQAYCYITDTSQDDLCCISSSGTTCMSDGGGANSFATWTDGTTPAVADSASDTMTVNDGSTINFTTTDEPETLTAEIVANSVDQDELASTITFATGDNIVLPIEDSDQTTDGEIDYDTTEEVIEVGDDGTATHKFFPVDTGTYTANAFCTADATLNNLDCDQTNVTQLGADISLTSEATANQGTTTTFLRGNAAGQPSWESINLAADVGSSILPVANGGTNNAFFAVSGPATSEKTYTFPNANATMEYQANKGANNGYAGLDGSGLVADTDLPTNAVLDDEANTYSSGLQDFSSVTINVPTATAGDSDTSAASTDFVDRRYQEKCKTIESLTVSDDNVFIWGFHDASTVTSVACNSDAAATVVFTDYADNTVETVTCDTDGSLTWDESMSGTATFTAGEVMNLDTTSASTPTWTMVCWRYRID